MNIDEIQQEISRLDACIEQVRVDFQPRLDALHEKFSPYVNTNRFPPDVRARARTAYKDAYIDLCGSLMRAIQVYSYPQRALAIQLKEHDRRVRMSAKDIAA